MNSKRALEIASSPVMANVTYNGSQVYIDAVNKDKNTAKIHFLSQQDNRREVSLDNLIEQGNLF